MAAVARGPRPRLPSSMARPKSTSGVARSVERMASPAVVSVMKALSTPPTGVGLV